MRPSLCATLAALLLVLLPPRGVGAPAPASESGRFIVKMRSAPAAGAFEALAARTGVRVLEARHITGGIHLLRVEGATAATTLSRLRADPQVAYAEPDQRRYAQATPDDPLYAGQWYMQNAEPAAVDASDAWDLTSGSFGAVIAELDTGVRFDHPDLRGGGANRLLPGYDMISVVATGNTGLGRNSDASDPGDWVSAQDTKSATFSGCTVQNSSWHGTRVAGILGAITNNDTGIAGMTWSGWTLPVRVLGKCGGYDSDILAGMAWAAGFPVEGVPSNPYPARVLNMSLGAVGSCPAGYQDLIDQLVTAGVLVVVSAGNEGGPVDAPANCRGAVGVAGIRHVGTKVGFSSLGPEVSLSAPAGNCVNTGANEPCLFSIETTTNTGTTAPATNTYTDQFNYNVGTSFSAPIVSAIAGLMLAVNGNLNATQLLARLKSGATTPFPAPAGVQECHVPAGAEDLQTSECTCTTQVCGAGMANANGAVLEALRPIAAVSLPAHVSPGANVALDGSGSTAACGATITTYAWSAGPGAPPIQNPDSAHASVVAPTGTSTYQLLLTVTDDAGRTDQATVVVTANTASSAAPAFAGTQACLTPLTYSTSTSAGQSLPSGSGSGGGGALDLATLAAGLSLLLARRSRRS